jgi:membrane protein YdbS with pleckstrin-like domain
MSLAPMESRISSMFALPADSIETYLIADEQVLHIDAPALNAFVVEELPVIALATAAVVAAVLWGTSSDNLFLAGVAMIVTGSVLLYLRVKRWNQQYTAYVLTTARVMRISGFIRRSSAWIPWVKVTDVRFEESLMGRLLGYATVYIDSANETSGLAEMKNLRDPRGFYLMLTELVQLKQGTLPPSRSALLNE